MEIQQPKKTLAFDPDKASTLLEEIIEAFQRHRPSVGEIITVTSNLLYSLGASISPTYDMEIGEKGPSIEELNKLYYSEPGRIDVAMMLQGLTMSTWYQDWEKLQTGEENGSDLQSNQPEQ